MFDIGWHGVGLQHLHAALDASGDGLGLVMREVVPRLGAQNRQNGRQLFGGVGAGAFPVLAVRHEGQVIAVVDQLGRHVLDLQDEVDLAGRRRALRHPCHRMVVEPSLGDSQPAHLLDRREPRRTIGADA